MIKVSPSCIMYISHKCPEVSFPLSQLASPEVTCTTSACKFCNSGQVPAGSSQVASRSDATESFGEVDSQRHQAGHLRTVTKPENTSMVFMLARQEGK